MNWNKSSRTRSQANHVTVHGEDAKLGPVVQMGSELQPLLVSQPTERRHHSGSHARLYLCSQGYQLIFVVFKQGAAGQRNGPPVVDNAVVVATLAKYFHDLASTGRFSVKRNGKKSCHSGRLQFSGNLPRQVASSRSVWLLLVHRRCKCPDLPQLDPIYLPRQQKPVHIGIVGKPVKVQIAKRWRIYFSKKLDERRK